jgi:Uma2 family endonuclease
MGENGGFHGGDKVNVEEEEVVYLSCDKAGKSGMQVYVNMTLMLLLRDYFAAVRRPAFVCSNQFFYFKRGDPRMSVTPDVYVIDGESLGPTAVPNWKVWEHDGKGPVFALEVISDEYPKQYAERMIGYYEQLGVRELVVYDPEQQDEASRSLLVHWVADAMGKLVQRKTPPDRVQSAVFGFWLVMQPDRGLRLGLGVDGEDLWPTAEERYAAIIAARKADEARWAAKMALDSSGRE